MFSPTISHEFERYNHLFIDIVFSVDVAVVAVYIKWESHNEIAMNDERTMSINMIAANSKLEYTCGRWTESWSDWLMGARWLNVGWWMCLVNHSIFYCSFEKFSLINFFVVERGKKPFFSQWMNKIINFCILWIER